MATIDDLPQCGCLTCRDPRAAMIADLRDQCCCDERVCAPCEAVGRITGVYRCERCLEWFPLEQLTTQPPPRPQYGDVGDAVQRRCDGCQED